jgi:16S rRNA G966 N2-methylase RsmD
MNVVCKPQQGRGYLYLVESVKVAGQYKVVQVACLGSDERGAIVKLKAQNLSKPEEQRLIAKIRSLAGRLNPIARTDDEILKKASKITSQNRELKSVARKGEIEGILLENALIASSKDAPQISTGDTISLGRHTLTCGDSRLWRPEGRARMAFADPPYNSGVAEWDSGFVWGHDWLSDYADFVFVTPGIANLPNFGQQTAMIYRWKYTYWLSNGIARLNPWGYSNLIDALLFSASQSGLPISANDFCKGTIDTSLSHVTLHRGRKPEAMIRWLMSLVCNAGDIVIDPFLGSGTTLFAAEREGLVCQGSEINPEYCQQIINRWYAEN